MSKLSFKKDNYGNLYYYKHGRVLNTILKGGGLVTFEPTESVT